MFEFIIQNQKALILKVLKIPAQSQSHTNPFAIIGKRIKSQLFAALSTWIERETRVFLPPQQTNFCNFP